MAPYEWSFPFPHWVSKARSLLSLEPTELPTQETFALAHALQQTVRGYVAGSTGPHVWKDYMLANRQDTEESNVRTAIVRAEFQEGDRRHDGKGRGAIHIHCLFWLHNFRATGMEHEIAAHAPSEDASLAALVNHLQRSSAEPRIDVNEKPNHWSV